MVNIQLVQKSQQQKNSITADEEIYRSQAMAKCALGENYVVMKTCQDYIIGAVKALKVGNTDPSADEVNRPCKGQVLAVRAIQLITLTFHFNNSGMKNPYGLEGPTSVSYRWNGSKDQCCLAQGFNPRILGQTYVWGTTMRIELRL